MRISDWSSDVCSSDLKEDRRPVGGEIVGGEPIALHQHRIGRDGAHVRYEPAKMPGDLPVGRFVVLDRGRNAACFAQAVNLDHLDRKSVVSGKSVSVRVDLGGRRIIKKKITTIASTVSCQRDIVT